MLTEDVGPSRNKDDKHNLDSQQHMTPMNQHVVRKKHHCLEWINKSKKPNFIIETKKKNY